MRERFIAYGSRSVNTDPNRASGLQTRTKSEAAAGPKLNLTTSLLDALSSIQVPHGWFIHFYVLSVLCSLFWAAQFCANGRVLQDLITWDDNSRAQSLSNDQVMLVWLLMLVQGTRRLCECIALRKPTSSRMWFVHWAVGLAFYFTISISIWVEGTRKIVPCICELSTYIQ